MIIIFVVPNDFRNIIIIAWLILQYCKYQFDKFSGLSDHVKIAVFKIEWRIKEKKIDSLWKIIDGFYFQMKALHLFNFNIF